jgi:hypothetical protein
MRFLTFGYTQKVKTLQSSSLTTSPTSSFMCKASTEPGQNNSKEKAYLPNETSDYYNFGPHMDFPRV